MADENLIAGACAGRNCRSQVMAALGYMGILCFVPLLLNKDDEFVHFHAKQGLVIWMWGVIAMFALHVPLIGKWFFGFSSMAIVLFAVAGLASVAFNRAWRLPVISSLAAKI